MRQCYAIEIKTPKGVILNGLWFGPSRPKQVVIWVHGLSSTMFSKAAIMDEIVDTHTAVLAFNNRGHDRIARSSRRTRERFGAAHEVFTDCVDDIQGAVNFARRQKVKNIFLAGHSTGCQKSAYWASKTDGGRGVRGIILLAPMSDYAAEVMLSGKKKIVAAEKVARDLVRKGRPHELLPERVWGWSLLADAQRFISLYSGKSAEEIFTYWDPKRNPRVLRAIRKPTLALLAGKDEYADRPAEKIAEWFLAHVYTGETVVIPGVEHGFRGGETTVATAIRKFMKEC